MMNPPVPLSAEQKRSRTRMALWWTAAVLWAGFIFFMSAHTGSDLDDGSGIIGRLKQLLTCGAEALFGPGTDAVSVAGHFLEYAVFGALLTAALGCTDRHRALQAGTPVPAATPHRLAQATLVAIAIASLYGITDEFHQSFVPGRMPDIADWLTDTLGAAAGASLRTLSVRRRPKK